MDPNSEKLKVILDRLRKLIRTHKSCLEIGSIHEAEAAMLAINRLLTEYNLSLADVLEDDSAAPSADVVEGSSIRFAVGAEYQFATQLVSVICKFNYCKALFAGLGTNAPSATIVGQEINVQTCQFLFSFLRNNFTYNADKAARAHSLEPTKRTRYYRDFLHGTVHGIMEKFENEQTPQTTAIVKWNGEAIERYIAEKNNVTQHKSRADSRHVDYNAYSRGVTHGRGVSISKGINAASRQINQSINQ